MERKRILLMQPADYPFIKELATQLSSVGDVMVSTSIATGVQLISEYKFDLIIGCIRGIDMDGTSEIMRLRHKEVDRKEIGLDFITFLRENHISHKTDSNTPVIIYTYVVNFYSINRASAVSKVIFYKPTEHSEIVNETAKILGD